MKTVNIAALKNHLRAYLQEVRSGTEILVRDRRVLVARIVPFVRPGDDADELQALAIEGKLRPGEGSLDDSFWDLPAPRVPARVMKRAVERERDQR